MSNCVKCGKYLPEGMGMVCPNCGENATANNQGLTIKIKYHDAELPKAVKLGDWIDLRAAESVKLKKGEYKLLSLGVSMQLPEGYEAHLAPRSSTFKNFGVICANSFGIIDEAYCGDNDVWRFPVIAMRKTTILNGDRICQFRIVKKMPDVELLEVETLGNPDRGGVGSTGKN